MKFTIKAPNETVITLARKIGYFVMGVDPVRNSPPKGPSDRPAKSRTGVISNGMDERNEYNIARPLQRGKNYPRFHIYLTKSNETGEFEMNLHLDQKQPSYEGSSAHSGEYEGEIIEKEMERIRKILNF